jgi:hypothetical protein
VNRGSLSQGDVVQVRWGTKGDIYDAQVKRFNIKSDFYRVRFKNMTPDWDRWVPQEKIIKIFKNNVLA